MNVYSPTEMIINFIIKVVENEEDITIEKPNANVFVYIY